MMKIVVYTSLYPNNVWTHQGVFVKERMTHFAKETGASVRVVSPVPYFPKVSMLGAGSWSKFSQVCAQERIEGLEVYHPRYLLIPKVSMFVHGVLMALASLPLLRRLKRDSDFDLLDAHFVYPDGFAAVLLGRWLGKPVVVSARGSDINLYKDFPLIRKLLVFTLQRAHRVIAVSHALKQVIVSLGVNPEKVTVVPNGVDREKFFPIDKSHARQKLGLPDRAILLSVGNITPVKGFDLLISAIKVLVDQYRRTDLFLVIVGEGPHRIELENLVASQGLASHVRFAGDIPHEQLNYWYGAADLCCLASVREGWPNVVLEALACGRPVIGTKVGGIPEILTTPAVGILTERDARSLADAINQGLERIWDVDIIANHARLFSWSSVARAVLDVFAGAISSVGCAVQGYSSSSLVGRKVKP